MEKFSFENNKKPNRYEGATEGEDSLIPSEPEEIVIESDDADSVRFGYYIGLKSDLSGIKERPDYDLISGRIRNFLNNLLETNEQETLDNCVAYHLLNEVINPDNTKQILMLGEIINPEIERLDLDDERIENFIRNNFEE